MKYFSIVLVLVLAFGCVEKNYTPEELAAHSRGNSFHWLYNKSLGLEVPKGWKLLKKGYKAEYLSRVTGGADYVIFREENDGKELPVITLKVEDNKVALSPSTIKDQVAREEVVKKLLGSIGVYKYNLTHVEYDEKKNVFRWDADYQLSTQKDMYAGYGPSTRLKFQYAGIPRYRSVTREFYLNRAHFFVDRYELMITLGDGVIYWTDTPVKYEVKFIDDYNAVINSIVFK